MVEVLVRRKRQVDRGGGMLSPAAVQYQKQVYTCTQYCQYLKRANCDKSTAGGKSTYYCITQRKAQGRSRTCIERNK